LFDETDGVFRRTPEPIPENLTAICDLVKQQKCDIGFAQDPDGDRLSIIDNDGRCIGEQYSIVLAAEHVLSKNPGRVVVNIDTTKAIEAVAKKYKSTVHYSRVGEINVTTKMLELGAQIGGEGGSGGIIYPAVHPCRDSFTGMGLILEMLAVRQCSLTSILDTIPKYYVAKEKIACSSSDALQIMRRLKDKYAEQNPNTIDGLRLDWENAWLLLRPSNTEPIIRVIVEALSQEEADSLLKKFLEDVK
jgi:phosphomannomutase